ncbi:14723_t:CDS:10 [Gigaspora margarita]|uniref:14723_t:CDS:1 n=1 Tax=Gigaspora margarita TaxID=4874 RepID=A0ABN7VJE9_GIGMA|nr:14723_t:CDS:10 [Gigaspora margarita]
MSVLDSKVLKKLSCAEYWKRDSREWGSVSDWDIFYIDSVPGVSKLQAHNMLRTELCIIRKDSHNAKSNDICPCNYVERLIAQGKCMFARSGVYLPDVGKCMFARSGVHLLDVGIIKLDNSSNCKKDQGNIELWQKYSQKLGSLAVENRVHKREILTTGIRAATGAVVAEFPYEILETADYEDNPLQTLSQSSTEDNLVEEHFETLRKREIVGCKMDKQDFKECGLELGPAIRLADFVKELNDQIKTSPTITKFNLNKFLKELKEDLAHLQDELQIIKRDVQKIKCEMEKPDNAEQEEELKTLPETTSTEVSTPANVDTKPIICGPTYPAFPIIQNES